MSWFIGENSKVIDLSRRYWFEIDRVVQSKLVQFFKKYKPFLNLEEFRKLHKKNYLNADLPFGKFDRVSTVGMVAVNAEQVEKFEFEVSKSLRLLSEVPEFNTILKSVVKCFVPLTNTQSKNNLRRNGSGKSCHWMKGAIFLSLPEKDIFSEIELSINIAHEIGHQVLMIYQDCDEIMPDISRPIFSAVRKTNRPAIMSMHALVAIYFMYRFVGGLLESPVLIRNRNCELYLKSRLERLFSDFVEGSFALKNVDFSPLGEQMMAEMVNELLIRRVTA